MGKERTFSVESWPCCSWTPTDCEIGRSSLILSEAELAPWFLFLLILLGLVLGFSFLSLDFFASLFKSVSRTAVDFEFEWVSLWQRSCDGFLKSRLQVAHINLRTTTNKALWLFRIWKNYLPIWMIGTSVLFNCLRVFKTNITALKYFICFEFVCLWMFLEFIFTFSNKVRMAGQ